MLGNVVEIFTILSLLLEIMIKAFCLTLVTFQKPSGINHKSVIHLHVHALAVSLISISKYLAVRKNRILSKPF